MQICGRDFTASELAWIREQVDGQPQLSRVQLSRIFCEHTGWYKPDGQPKEMSCRVALLRLERKGLIRLPAAKIKPAPVGKVPRTLFGEAQQPIRLEAPTKLKLQPVERETSSFWNELIDRYHYLGYCRMGGAQMRFFVYAQDRLVALLAFSAAAWRVAARDAFIGWTETQRKAGLPQVVNNSRFLILPWIQCKNLASRILSLAARKLPDYWQQHYNYRPLLLETFVEKERFTGTCYKAANWICVGHTRGRGKWDRQNAFDKPVKTVWLYPLTRRFREGLCG